MESFAWYAEAVRFVVEQGIMQGIGGGLFDPNGVMNRSMLVTMLHRLAGEPGGGTASFTDVSAGIWYSDAVAWAASAELTGGYGDGRFGPTDAVTREQVAALLFRYAQLQKLELAADQSVPDFSDTASVSGWAKEAWTGQCARACSAKKRRHPGSPGYRHPGRGGHYPHAFHPEHSRNRITAQAAPESLAPGPACHYEESCKVVGPAHTTLFVYIISMQISLSGVRLTSARAVRSLSMTTAVAAYWAILPSYWRIQLSSLTVFCIEFNLMSCL